MEGDPTLIHRGPASGELQVAGVAPQHYPHRHVEAEARPPSHRGERLPGLRIRCHGNKRTSTSFPTQITKVCQAGNPARHRGCQTAEGITGRAQHGTPHKGRFRAGSPRNSRRRGGRRPSESGARTCPPAPPSRPAPARPASPDRRGARGEQPPAASPGPRDALNRPRTDRPNANRENHNGCDGRHSTRCPHPCRMRAAPRPTLVPRCQT